MRTTIAVLGALFVGWWLAFVFHHWMFGAAHLGWQIAASTIWAGLAGTVAWSERRVRGPD